MTDPQQTPGAEIVPSPQRNLALRPTTLVQRGLDAITRLEETQNLARSATFEDFLNAGHKGNSERVSAILRHDPSKANAVSKHGATALMIAAHAGNSVMANLLIARGAAVNARSPSRQTALHFAYSSLPVMELLIANGAETNPKDNCGDTPLDFVLDGEAASVLRRHGCKTAEELARKRTE